MTNNIKEQGIFTNFPWSLVFILAAIQLVRPLMSIAGLFESTGPAGRIIMTAVIAILWVGIAVLWRLKNPIVVLAVAGAVYAIASTLLGAVIQLILPGSGGEEAVSVPFLLTVGLLASTATNIIWGAFLGLIAQIIMNLSKRA